MKNPQNLKDKGFDKHPEHINKNGREIDVLPAEVEILRKAGKLMEEKPDESDSIKTDENYR